MDIKDVSNRIIRILQGSEEEITDCEEAYIVFADDLTPSETVQMDS